MAQYTVFVEDNGYNQESFWTPLGWEWRNENYINLPKYWQDEQLHKAEHPIIGVSWYEAMAFCGWLSEKVEQTILLPTEQQWQWAARGHTGWDFPWGAEFDANRSNTKLTGTTTPVTHFPEGCSPFGVMDMHGNIWEWCFTEYDTAKNGGTYATPRRVLRGSSWLTGWSDDSEDVSVDYRAWKNANHSFRDVGFRIAALLNSDILTADFWLY